LLARGEIPDYLVFVDRVDQQTPRWHAFGWHI
jgi:hypothetical protein